MSIVPIGNSVLFEKILNPAGVSVLTGMMLLRSPQVHADEGNNDDSRIQQGFAIAPVPLTLTGLNHDLVGLGSYIVNEQADCNSCHGLSPATEFSAGGNPFFLFPAFFNRTKKINPATYLAGGRDFGRVGSVPHLYSRNLTPDYTGLPEGGHTFSEFLQIFRQGTDFDKVHPNCPNVGALGCFNPPFNGALLQVMPWPNLQNMTDHDIQAIYEYLSAIPCNTGHRARCCEGSGQCGPRGQQEIRSDRSDAPLPGRNARRDYGTDRLAVAYRARLRQWDVDQEAELERRVLPVEGKGAHVPR
jgi:hypothetical protein